MKLGFAQRVISPPLKSELVGYIPSREAESIEKDLLVKTITIINDEEVYIWLTCDLLGLDVYFKEMLLKKLKDNSVNVTDLQMFTTHTHSGPRVLSEQEYHHPDVDKMKKAYFDFLVNQAYNAVLESLSNVRNFTYKVAIGKMENFQTNRINKDAYSHDDILAVEVTLEDDTQALFYSFSGHPTILDRFSTRISPDYVGEVAKILEVQYSFTMFFNAPCGDMSTRYTKSESSLNELYRLGKIAADNVLKTLEQLSEAKTIKNYTVDHYTYRLNFKQFLSEEEAQKQYDKALAEFKQAEADKLDPLEIRSFRATYEGAMFNLNHSKQEYKQDYTDMDISIITIDDYKIVTLPSEIFSTLAKPLKLANTWTISLADQYQTYLTDKKAYDDNTYEALSSLYARGQGEKLIEFVKNKL